MMAAEGGCHNTRRDDVPWTQVTVVFRTKDCAQKGHSGYVYIDQVCGDEGAAAGDPVLDIDKNVCPSNGGVMADGSGSGGAISAHFWSVQESTSGWVGYGPEVSQWFTGHPGVKDVQAFAADKGLTMRCGRHYRVKLAVSNECATWASTTELIFLDCPVIDAGPDQWICIGESATIALAGALPPSYNFLGWSTSNGVFVSTSSPTTVTPTSTTTYVATVEDTADGNCEGWDDVMVGVSLASIGFAAIVQQPVCDCSNRRRLCAVANGQELEAGTTFAWNTGETTQCIVVDNPPFDECCFQVTYSVTIANACGSKWAATTVEHIGKPLDFWAPNAFYPHYGPFTVIHAMTSIGIRPSYGKYTTLRVFSRWGEVIYQQTARCEDERPNGWLQWNGVYEGKVVPTNVYDYTLEFDDKCDGSAPTTWAFHVTAIS